MAAAMLHTRELRWRCETVGDSMTAFVLCAHDRVNCGGAGLGDFRDTRGGRQQAAVRLT